MYTSMHSSWRLYGRNPISSHPHHAWHLKPIKTYWGLNNLVDPFVDDILTLFLLREMFYIFIFFRSLFVGIQLAIS